MDSNDFSSQRANGNASGNGQNNSAIPAIPPPVPPRPILSSVANPGFYGGGYASTYGGGYGSSPMYGPGYGSPYSFGTPSYGQYGYSAMPPQESSLVRMAEEGSRPAFQSVESVVHAFTSISMMLESSYNAIYSSFRAVLGVADQFSRLKTHFTQIFTTLAIVKFLRWLYRRALVLLRLKPANYANSAELMWSNAEGLGQLGAGGKAPGSGGWSGIAYLAIVLGGPLLIWKLLVKIAGQVENSRKWAKGEGDYFEAKVLYSFNGVEENELSVEAGSTIRIAPKELQPAMRGWLMGSTIDGENIGLVPMNYIEIIGRKNAQRNIQLPSERDLEAAFRAT